MVLELRDGLIAYGRDTGIKVVLAGTPMSQAVDDRTLVVTEPIAVPTNLIPTAHNPLRTKRVRPVVSGISVGHIEITAGTIGWFAELNGKHVLVSNAHVLTPRPDSELAPPIKAIVQPGTYDAGFPDPRNIVAEYHSHVPVRCVEDSNCPLANLTVHLLNLLSRLFGRKSRFRTYVEQTNTVDIALAQISPDLYSPVIMDDNGEYIRPPGKLVGFLFAGNREVFVVAKAKNVLKYYPELKLKGVEIADVEPGQRVVKYGRTTGRTEGVVLSAEGISKIMGYPCGTAVFEDVIIVLGESAGGDSGSAVWLVE